MIIGSHVHFGKEQLLGSVKEAISYGANAFMFYTGAPQNTVRLPINNELTRKAKSLMYDNNIDINNVICHAPYIVNPATSDKIKKDFAINFLSNEIKRCSELGVKYIVLHPGSAVGIERDVAINNIIDVLNQVLNNSYDVMILLETMAGKGNEVGKTTDELKRIINNINYQDKIGICLDTCHLNDSGIDISYFDDYLDDFDKKIGINKIFCVHINDSKNEIGSHKDRHDNIGFGTIGFDNIMNVINNKRLINIPFILETPYIGDSNDSKERLYPPYKHEIKMIKNNIFNDNLLNDIRNEYSK